MENPHMQEAIGNSKLNMSAFSYLYLSFSAVPIFSFMSGYRITSDRIL